MPYSALVSHVLSSASLPNQETPCEQAGSLTMTAKPVVTSRLKGLPKEKSKKRSGFMSPDQGVVWVPNEKLDSRVRVFRRALNVVDEFEGMEVDAYAVITRRYVVICDTMLCPQDMAVLVQEIQSELAGRQLLVFNSHADWDHCWGNGYFTGALAAPIIAHDSCRSSLLSPPARATLAAFQRFPLFNSVILTPPTVTFPKTLTLYGGDLTLEWMHTPGHQPEHISLWIPELRVLFAFDAAEQPFPHIESAAAAPAMLATLERLLALQPQFVLCSHGKTASLLTLEENLTYLREIERRCRAFLSAHRPEEVRIEQAPALIDFPFEMAITTLGELSDRAYYSETHNDNVRCIMQWVVQAFTLA
jgi:glyoxylase-like metal-dependent hydrolase (beta-lactamase superfamily II)